MAATRRKKQPIAKKRPSKKGKPCLRVTVEEAERMFKKYCEVADQGGNKAVAEAFKRSRSTVIRIAKRDNWEDRRAEIKAQVQRKTEKDVAENAVRNVRMAEAVRKASFKGLFAKDEDGQTILKNDPTISDAIRAGDYADRIQDRYGIHDENIMTPFPPEVVDRALGMFEKLGDKGLKALGDLIVRTFETPEDLEAAIAEEVV